MVYKGRVTRNSKMSEKFVRERWEQPEQFVRERWEQPEKFVRERWEQSEKFVIERWETKSTPKNENKKHTKKN